MYDPESATDDAVNKLFINAQMYEMTRVNSKKYPQGTGQMVLGRIYSNRNKTYGKALFDDLKMWNRKLSDEEIVRMSS